MKDPVDKAVRRYQAAMTVYESARTPSPRQRAALRRFAVLSQRAESALLYAVRAHPANLAPRIAYSEIAARRSWVYRAAGLPMFHGSVVQSARAAVWGIHQPMLDRLDPGELLGLARGDPFPSPFVPAGAVAGVVTGAAWLSEAARQWFQLAEVLARFRLEPRAESTPEQVDAAVWEVRSVRSIEGLVGDCRLASCTGLPVLGEAQVLAREALRICRAIEPVEPDVGWAVTRHDEIVALLPGGVGDEP